MSVPTPPLKAPKARGNDAERASRLRAFGWVMALGVGLLIALALTVNGGARAVPQEESQTLPTSSVARSPLLVRLRGLSLNPSEMGGSGVAGRSDDLGTSSRLWLVQFPGPIQEVWYAAMIRLGVEVIDYIPDFTYLVWASGRSIAQLRSNAPVRWVGLYRPAYALHPVLRGVPTPTAPLTVTVQLVDHPDVVSTLADVLRSTESRLCRSHDMNGKHTLKIRISVSALDEIAATPGVINVEPVLVAELLDEVQGQIIAGDLNATQSGPTGPGYLNWLTATVGMTTTPSAYPIVDVTDDGIGDGDAIPTHPNFYLRGDSLQTDRLIYNFNYTDDLLADGQGGHGTLNASIVVGYNDRSGTDYEDALGYNYGLGINPFGRVAGSKVFSNQGYWAYPDYVDLIQQSYKAGARISSNSWGDESGDGSYRWEDQAYDALVRDADPDTLGNQPMVVVFSAGNGGPTDQTIGSPGNAKNVITVGASESVRPDWTDGCSIGPSGADDAREIIGFSSRGPTADGRMKPDLVAPGTHIVAAASQIGGYTGATVCDKYYPGDQTLYAASSGTSHSTPAVAGAASLVMRYYQDRFGALPSPAMVKAYLINAARYLDSPSAGGNLPSPDQGYGGIDLGVGLDVAERIVVDQSEVLRSTGAVYVMRGYVSAPSKPLRLTLAWTDAPGSTVGAAYVNDLDLVVEVGGKTYRGNDFSGAYAVVEGDPDRLNNVESVHLAPGISGPLTVTVQAYNLAGDGVPGDSDLTDQDFALVCYNCEQRPAFDLDLQPAQLDLCAPGTASLTVTSRALGGFSDMITLQASEYPAGTSLAFEPNPVSAEGASLLSMEASGNTPAGRYDVRVIGGSDVHTDTVLAEVRIFSEVPPAPDLNRPADGSLDLPPRPTLHWSEVVGAAEYRLELATETTFSSLVYSATTEAVSHTLTSSLAFGMRYHWRVVPLNPCGEGPPSLSHTLAIHQAPLLVCRTPESSIPDRGGGVLTSQITVPETFPVLDLNVALTATHSWVGDLVITLTHEETGAEVVLFDRPGIPPEGSLGCSGEDLDLVFDDEGQARVEDSCQNTRPAYPSGEAFRPNDALSAVTGYGLAGRWTVQIEDMASLDTGTLHRWCLIPTVMSEAAVPTLTFDSQLYQMSATEPSIPITISLSDASVQTVTVRYATRDGTALAGTHYLTTTGMLTFPAGSLARSFDVPLLSPPGPKVTRTLSLELANPRYAVLGSPAVADIRLATNQMPWRIILVLIFRNAAVD